MTEKDQISKLRELLTSKGLGPETWALYESIVGKNKGPKMTDSRKEKLVALGAETLADTLLTLAVHSDHADDMIERLIATPKENIQRFKKKLSGLKRRKRFINWHESHKFADELEMLLQDLKSGVEDPLVGLELVASFYEADNAVFEICDDSSGYIGDIFRYTAQELFVDYASRCDDKKKIAKIILKVNQKDNYGVRDSLIECAVDCLPEDIIRTMIETLQTRANQEQEDHRKHDHLRLIESLARQIKDAKLFEEARIASWGKLNSAAFIDIAQVYLESGDVETAHSWVKKVPKGDVFKAYERDKLLETIYRRLGDTEKLAEILFQKFKSYRSPKTLQTLLDVIGEDKRDEVVANEIELVLKANKLHEQDAQFLIEIGKMDEAEIYLLARVDQLNGDNYNSLVFLAEAMESENRHLAASLIYRSLLISILERGNTKAYYAGVRHLKKLDTLAANAIDWKEWDNHEAFTEQITQKHGRKRSFWSKYEVK